MRVRMISTMSGPEGVHLSGSDAEFDEAVAVDLIARGYAEPLADPRPKAEAAILHAPEAAIEPASDAAVLPHSETRHRRRSPS